MVAEYLYGINEICTYVLFEYYMQYAISCDYAFPGNDLGLCE